MIKTIIFDLGGVIINIDRERSVAAFQDLGLKNASSYLDCYKQKGFFWNWKTDALMQAVFVRS